MTDALSRLRGCGLFDAAWYRDRNPDAERSGMTPETHFLRYGRLLGRDPGPDFDTAFCLETYADLAAGRGNPLLDFLDLPDAGQRPRSAAEWRARVAAMRRGPVAPGRIALSLPPGPGGLALRHSRDALARLPAEARARLSQQPDQGALPEVHVLMDAGEVIDTDRIATLLDLARRHLLGFVLFDGESVAASGWLIPDPWQTDPEAPEADHRVALVLELLRRHPALPLICGPQGLAANEPALARLLAGRPLANRMIALPGLGPVPGGFPLTGARRAARGFDRAMAAYRDCIDPDLRQEVLHALNRRKMALTETAPPDLLAARFLRAASRPARIGPEDITLLACIRDEADFLTRLIPHYRALGVTRFLLVDDHSAQPVAGLGLGPDVSVFTPREGDFRSCKNLWLQILMQRHLPRDAWALNVDADEFLSLPAPFTSLGQLTRHLDDRGQDMAAGLLIDMVPDPSAGRAPEADPRAGMTLFLRDEGRPDPAYLAHPTIRWGFGNRDAALSWRFDLRHRLFGTVDSLRKIPLFRHRPHRHPNQGFHNFDCLDTSLQPGPEIWRRGPVLPILHYKLARLFDEDRRQGMLHRASAYHAQAQRNITQGFAAQGAALRDRLAALRPHLVPVDQIDLVSRDFRDGGR